ncbi:MAG: transglutaminase domain-containing protein [Gemmataceae bacterium]|nr:transglutaminase domain-containing protein [Gemmataceae bacterium]
MLAVLLAISADLHETAWFDGVRVGHQRISVVEKDGKRLVSSALDLTFRRYGETARIRREEGTVEDAGGVVLGTFMRQAGLSLVGTVDGDRLRVRSQPAGRDRAIMWPGEVLGPLAQMEQFAARKPRPGDKWAFRRWEPTYNAVLTVMVEAKGREKVKGRELLRVELVPDSLDGGTRRIHPARSTWWLDEAFVPVRKQSSLEGLGTLVLERADKAAALAPVRGETPDLGKASFARASRAIVRPYDTSEAMYRVAVAGEPTEGLFPSDDHQAASVNKESVLLLVKPARPGKPKEGKAGEEFLASNAWIDSDDPKVAAQARRIAGEERSPWRKALRIERWVHGAMANDSSAELASASKALASRRGDCRHHAFLCAALCRAAGVPSRTAIGFLYVSRGGPRFGFHMWAEVFIEGRWLGIDSTLGRGGVSAAHVKVTDHSWHKQDSLAPLLPVQRVVGKVRFDVVEAR